MNDPKDISFVRVNILENWRFWNQYRLKDDIEAAGREVIAQADALLAQDTNSNQRAAELLNEGIEFRRKKQAAGKAGGEAKARNFALENPPPQTPPTGQPPRKPSTPQTQPPTLEELYDFCFQESLDEAYAREWYELTVVERNFKDRNGEPVKDWKKMCKAYVQKRST